MAEERRLLSVKGCTLPGAPQARPPPAAATRRPGPEGPRHLPGPGPPVPGCTWPALSVLSGGGPAQLPPPPVCPQTLACGDFPLEDRHRFRAWFGRALPPCGCKPERWPGPERTASCLQTARGCPPGHLAALLLQTDAPPSGGGPCSRQWLAATQPVVHSSPGGWPSGEGRGLTGPVSQALG